MMGDTISEVPLFIVAFTEWYHNALQLLFIKTTNGNVTNKDFPKLFVVHFISEAPPTIGGHNIGIGKLFTNQEPMVLDGILFYMNWIDRFTMLG